MKKVTTVKKGKTNDCKREKKTVKSENVYT